MSEQINNNKSMEDNRVMKYIWVLLILTGIMLGLQISMYKKQANSLGPTTQVDNRKCTSANTISYYGMDSFTRLIQRCETEFDYCAAEEECKRMVIQAEAEAEVMRQTR